MTNCVSGQRVVSEPTPTSNRQCAACPAGTFSQGTNAQDCVPWRECSGAFKEDAPGSATTDRTCKPEWIAQLGSTTSDQALSDSVHVDASGDVILGCRVGSTDVDVAKVFKRSGIDGSEIWTSEPPIGAGDTVFGVGLDQDGGALVVGTTFGNLDGGGQAGNGDAFVMKLSASDGSVVWTTQFGTANHEGAYSVTVDAGGNLIVQGQGHNGVSGPSNFNWNVFVTKLSGTDRTEIWTRTFDSGAPDNALAVGVAPDGSVLLAGNTQGTLAGMGNAGGRDAFVSRLSDTDGAPIWTRQLGSASDDSFLSARADANGNVVVVGRQDSNGVVMKLSGTDGSGLWTHQSADSFRLNSIVADANGDILAAGRTTDWDMVVAKLAGSDGQELWLDQFGTPQNDHARGLALGDDGAAIVSGGTTGDMVPGSAVGFDDCFLFKLAD